MSDRLAIGMESLKLSVAKPKKLLIVGTGAGLLGVALAINPGAGVGCALVGLVAGLMLAYTPAEERRFVGSVLLVALGLKIALAGLYQSYLFTGGPALFAPDGEAFSKFGWYISRVLWGRDPNVLPSAEYTYGNYDLLIRAELHGALPPLKYQIGPYTYFLGFLYAAFGYSPLLARIINVLLYAATAFIAMRLAGDLAGRREAKAVFLLVLFWPSMALFSISMLRDSAIVFVIMMVVWSAHRLFQRTPLALAGVVGGLVLLGLLRRQAAWLLIAILVVWGVWHFLRLKRALLLGVLVGAFVLGLGTTERPLKDAIIRHTILYHAGYLTSTGVNYSLLPSHVAKDKHVIYGDLSSLTWGDILGIYFRGVAHYLTEPWPSNLKTLKLKVFFPQMIVWYACLVLVLPGFMAVWRRRDHLVGLIVIFLAAFVSLSGLTEGTIGILIRHRDMITPLVLILAAAGFFAVSDRVKALCKN